MHPGREHRAEKSEYLIAWKSRPCASYIRRRKGSGAVDIGGRRRARKCSVASWYAGAITPVCGVICIFGRWNSRM